jgi:hypothetical protein
MEAIVAPWVSYCRIGDTEIALDLKSNRYFSAPAGTFSLAVEALAGRTIPDSVAAQMLIKRGAVLLGRPDEVPERAACTHPIPMATFGYDRLQAVDRLTGIASSALALVSITAGLKMRPLLKMIAPPARIPRHDQHLPETTAGTLQAFRAARMLFPGNEDCLRDALALRLLLAKVGLSATLVMGVSLAPFQAHSWLEAGGVVLGDSHERVAYFKPILAVQ